MTLPHITDYDHGISAIDAEYYRPRLAAIHLIVEGSTAALVDTGTSFSVPSLARTIWGNPERFRKTYFPEDLGGKYYLSGDSANCDLDGYFWIMGRIDDVLNISGHRLGTMEIESALVANHLVAEAAVVGKPHEIKGEVIVAFVVLKDACPQGEDAKKIAAELRNWVSKEIGPIAKPEEIRFGDNLPKTRSGKIMRRLLRAIARGDQIALVW